MSIPADSYTDKLERQIDRALEANAALMKERDEWRIACLGHGEKAHALESTVSALTRKLEEAKVALDVAVHYMRNAGADLERDYPEICVTLSPEQPEKPEAVETGEPVAWGELGGELRADARKATAPLREAMAARREREPSEGDPLADLVSRFGAALLEKLRYAEAKYGYSDAWMRGDWRDELVMHLRDHIEKGDPRDVAAYAAFAWHHGWSVASPEQPEKPEAVETGEPVAWGDQFLAQNASPEDVILAMTQAHQMETRVLYEALERALSHFVVVGTDQAALAAREIEELLTGKSRTPAASPVPDGEARRKAPTPVWHLGSMNDGLFIINAPPRPSTDDMHHEREDGPTVVLNVTELPNAKAQAIVDVLNRVASPVSDGEARRKALETDEDRAWRVACALYAVDCGNLDQPLRLASTVEIDLYMERGRTAVSALAAIPTAGDATNGQ